MAYRNTTEVAEQIDPEEVLKLASEASEHIRIHTGKVVEFFLDYANEIHVIEAGVERFASFDLDHCINYIMEENNLAW